MRLHFHRWTYPAGGATMRICRRCIVWQVLGLRCGKGRDLWVTYGRER